MYIKYYIYSIDLFCVSQRHFKAAVFLRWLEDLQKALSISNSPILYEYYILRYKIVLVQCPQIIGYMHLVRRLGRMQYTLYIKPSAREVRSPIWWVNVGEYCERFDGLG